MQITDHRLEGAPFVEAHAYGKDAITPNIILLHDTAGRLERGSSVGWFKSAECNTSAHVVVERDGSITQMVPFDRRAFHAGKSSYNGRSIANSVNSFSIGIEIVNPGALGADGSAWFKAKFPIDQLKKVKTKEHGDSHWMPYTADQVSAVTELCKALVDAYPEIHDITTHWFVSPGRKVDPNPLFPVDEVRQAVFAPRGEAVAALAPQPVAVSAKEVHLTAHAELKEQSTPYVAIDKTRAVAGGGTIVGGGIWAAVQGALDATEKITLTPEGLLNQVGAAAQLITKYGLPMLGLSFGVVLLCSTVQYVQRKYLTG